MLFSLRRVLNGVIILGKACQLIESAEKRSTGSTSAAETTDKKKEIDTCISGTKVNQNKEEPQKVEAATSPIRGWSLPPPLSTVRDKLTPKSLTPTPELTTPVSASMGSTPSSTGPPRSGSLDFLGESKKGLMANSMVNLSSVGINEGPYTSDVTRQYWLQHSLESIVSADSSDIVDSSLEQQPASQPQTPCVSSAAGVTPIPEDQTERVQTLEESSKSSPSKNMDVEMLPEEVRKAKRPPFLSCDSLRYRGSTDTGDLL